ncbi:hypothetical protein A2U01_0085124, partial [Trifolium medium]|nr:hypothetical protein [Trifolium medium]
SDMSNPNGQWGRGEGRYQVYTWDHTNGALP